MKEKSDFVTNSSTTCFFAYGCTFSDYELINNENFLKKAYEAEKEYRQSKGLEAITFEDWKYSAEQDGIREVIDALMNKYELVYCYYWDADELMIGRSPWKMKDDETIGEFRESVTKAFQEMGIEQKPGIIEEAWRDG